MQRRHHDCRTSTAALSTIWCYEAGHMAGSDASEGQAVWQPGGAEEDSRLREGNRHLHLAYDEERRRSLLCFCWYRHRHRHHHHHHHHQQHLLLLILEPRLRRDFSGVESYQWLKNWNSNGYPARRLAFLGQRWDWSARCQYTVTGWGRKFDLQLLSQCGRT